MESCMSLAASTRYFFRGSAYQPGFGTTQKAEDHLKEENFEPVMDADSLRAICYRRGKNRNGQRIAWSAALDMQGAKVSE